MQKPWLVLTSAAFLAGCMTSAQQGSLPQGSTLQVTAIPAPAPL
jgi:hypothetical protein